MENAKTIANLFQLSPPDNATEVIVYCEEITPRLQAACLFVFETAMQCRFQLRMGPAPENSATPAMVYGRTYKGSLLQVPAQGFLSETGVRPLMPEAMEKQGNPVFFPMDSDFGFDLFSSVFYFISRYEEYQDFEKDEHERFELQASVLFKRGWHLRPLLEQWVKQLAHQLHMKYPDFKISGRCFQVMSSVDVDNLYAYRGKGIFRTTGAALRDLVKGNRHAFRQRLRVLRGAEKDPFDIYEMLADFCFRQRIPLFVFFLMRSRTRYDRSVNPTSPLYQEVVKTLEENQAVCGLHPSYHMVDNPELLARELQHLRYAGIKKTVTSRQHFLRFDIRTSPNLLQSAGIQFDFTMGFASGIGLRAGTSLPFRWYNFQEEKNEDLTFIPFCAMDGVWSVYGDGSTEKAERELLQLASAIHKEKGIFLTVFHERSFSDHLYPGFGSLYKKLYSEVIRLFRD